MGTIWSTNMVGAPSWVDPRRLARQVWDATTAKSIPGVGRSLGIYGMASACKLLHFRTVAFDPRAPGDELGLSRFLQRPDPDTALPTFIGVHLEDYLLQGNACHLVTARGADGRPAAVRWFPCHKWGIQDKGDGQPTYLLDGVERDRDDVVHVRRGSDPNFEWRGIGVVEQHVGTLNQAGLERAAQTENLASRGMPNVVITQPPGSEFDQTNADEVAVKWEERFGTQTGKPGVFPAGTTVMPLSWNPSDQELNEARKMTLLDVANAFNLDGYWLGVQGSSHQYKSPSPMFLTLLTTSLNPVLATFEDEWSFRWLPYGRAVAFDRLPFQTDDLQTMVSTFAKSTSKTLFPDPNEPRRYMGFPALPDSAWPAPPPQLVAATVEEEPDAIEEPADEPVPELEEATT